MTRPLVDARYSRHLNWRVTAAIGAAVLISGGVMVIVFGLGGTRSSSLHDLLSPEVGIHPVEATSELCADVGCLEGWQTDIGSYLRFYSEGSAEHWVQVLGDDGRKWQNTVLDLRGHELTFDQKRKAVDVLFSTRDWS